MNSNTIHIIFVIATLIVFLVSLTAFKYTIKDRFSRVRLSMTAFLIFIFVTITISFLQYALYSLYFTIPAFFVGAVLGYRIGVHTERQKIATKGIEHYIEHFAHIRKADLKKMAWWSIVNFYSIIGALILINLIGLSLFIFPDLVEVALFTMTVAAFLIGTIVPYILHLWSIKHERV